VQELGMGLLDQVLGALGQQAGGSGQNQMLDLVMQLINSQPGGLQGLIERFAQGGLGQQAQSWVSTGQNLPISPEQLLKVLGGGPLSQLTQQAGLSDADAAGGLADLLPRVVDQLTPNGAIQNDVVEQGLSALRGKLGL
jgi:uncharacterized protein YidB (DUF937 family)